MIQPKTLSFNLRNSNSLSLYYSDKISKDSIIESNKFTVGLKLDNQERFLLAIKVVAQAIFTLGLYPLLSKSCSKNLDRVIHGVKYGYWNLSGNLGMNIDKKILKEVVKTVVTTMYYTNISVISPLYQSNKFNNAATILRNIQNSNPEKLKLDCNEIIFQYFKKAHDQGIKEKRPRFVEPSINLALMTYYGVGTDKNIELAFDHLQFAHPQKNKRELVDVLNVIRTDTSWKSLNLPSADYSIDS